MGLTSKCGKCGAQVPTANQFCGVCGQSLTAPGAPGKPSGKAAAPGKVPAGNVTPAAHAKPPAKTVVAQGKMPVSVAAAVVRQPPVKTVTAVPSPEPVPAAAGSRSVDNAAAVPPAEKKGCGVLAWLTTGIGCIIVLLAAVALLALVFAGYMLQDDLALMFNPSPQPAVPPVTGGVQLPVAPPVTPPSPPVTPVAPAGGYADYVGSWFSVNGDLGEDNTIVMRMEGGQLVCVSANGANRMTLAMQADGSVYGVAYGEGMNVPVRGQLTADRQQLNLTALYEASEPSTMVFQRVK